MKVVWQVFNFLTGEITVKEREIDADEMLKHNPLYQSLLKDAEENKKGTLGGETNRETDDAQ